MFGLSDLADLAKDLPWHANLVCTLLIYLGEAVLLMVGLRVVPPVKLSILVWATLNLDVIADILWISNRLTL